MDGHNKWVSKKPETLLKERVYPILKKLPSTWVKKIQQVAIRGTPDFLMCISGVFVAIELKRSEDEKPDALQELNLSKIADCGGLTIVMHPQNEQKVLNFLKTFAEKAAMDKTKKARIQ